MTNDQQLTLLEVDVGVTQKYLQYFSRHLLAFSAASLAPHQNAYLILLPFQVWMLTGDKVDTAINIGHSCSLLNTDMTTLRLCADDEEEDTAKDAKTNGGTGGSGDGGKNKVFGKEEAVVVTVERTSLELDASGVPSEASLRG